MPFQREPVNGNQSPSGHCRLPASDESHVAKCLQSFTDATLIAKSLAIKCNAGFADLNSRCWCQIKQPKDCKVSLAEDDALGHSSDFITMPS